MTRQGTATGLVAVLRPVTFAGLGTAAVTLVAQLEFALVVYGRGLSDVAGESLV